MAPGAKRPAAPPGRRKPKTRAEAGRTFRRIEPPRNLTGELAARIGEEITTGRLAPSARLPTEQEMMVDFGVSRTVVREAIAMLRAEGLVETRQGSGAFVTPDMRRRPFRIDPDRLQSIGQILDVMELRIAVEVEAAGLAAARRLPADLKRMAEAHAEFGGAVERGEAAVEEDYQLHRAIGLATGNPYFASFLDFVGRLIIPRRTLLVGAERPEDLQDYLARVFAEHGRIVGAIGTGQVAVARRRMAEHLKRGRERYRHAADGGEP
jgi:GntR family transcriptional regulator, transcriptional repressor for pyruvate dehydrogenase complex